MLSEIITIILKLRLELTILRLNPCSRSFCSAPGPSSRNLAANSSQTLTNSAMRFSVVLAKTCLAGSIVILRYSEASYRADHSALSRANSCRSSNETCGCKLFIYLLLFNYMNNRATWKTSQSCLHRFAFLSAHTCSILSECTCESIFIQICMYHIFPENKMNGLFPLIRPNCPGLLVLFPLINFPIKNFVLFAYYI